MVPSRHSVSIPIWLCGTQSWPTPTGSLSFDCVNRDGFMLNPDYWPLYCAGWKKRLRSRYVMDKIDINRLAGLALEVKSKPPPAALGFTIQR